MSNLSVAHLATKQKYKHYDLWKQIKDKIDIDRINTVNFLIDRGYYIFRINVKQHIFIRIINNIVKEVGKKDLVDEVLNVIKEKEEPYLYEIFLKNVGKWFNDDFLRTLPEKKIEIRKDTKDTIQLYFSNCICIIDKNGLRTAPYKELEGYIWESQILQRDFSEVELKPNFDFIRFVHNITQNDTERLNSLCSMFGFMLHNYKNPSYCPAIILNDEVISPNPEGGTGKGIIAKAIEKYRTMVIFDGKNMKADGDFLYQRVGEETGVVFFDDVVKNFNFEKLFSVITEGITVNRKGLAEVYIPFALSPKVIISTNYAIRGSGNSHDRRKNEIEIAQYYSKTFTPDAEFGRQMFDDWEASDWLQFDNFMAECCRYYLAEGIVEQKLVHLPEKKLIAETNSEFVEFMTGFEFLGTSVDDLYNKFISEYDDFKHYKWFTKTTLTRWVALYSTYSGYSMEREKLSDNWYYSFKNLHDGGE